MNSGAGKPRGVRRLSYGKAIYSLSRAISSKLPGDRLRQSPISLPAKKHFTYKAEVKTNVDPSEVSVLKPRGYDSVTLSTCDPPWGLSTRIIIFARLAESAPKA